MKKMKLKETDTQQSQSIEQLNNLSDSELESLTDQARTLLRQRKEKAYQALFEGQVRQVAEAVGVSLEDNAQIEEIKRLVNTAKEDYIESFFDPLFGYMCRTCEVERLEEMWFDCGFSEDFFDYIVAEFKEGA